MRCMVCGAMMRLVQVERLDSTMAPGFEHDTFECSVCHDIERRLVFSPQNPAPPAAASDAITTVPIANPEPHEADHALLRNAWEILWGRRTGA